jgi:hypothetical protein
VRARSKDSSSAEFSVRTDSSCIPANPVAAAYHSDVPPAGKRGNPNWGKPALGPFPPALPTEFETEVKRLRLTKQRYTRSAKLRDWCERNRNRIYIPEWLLDAWGIVVDAHVGGQAKNA